jgi:hypothetical protein
LSLDVLAEQVSESWLPGWLIMFVGMAHSAPIPFVQRYTASQPKVERGTYQNLRRTFGAVTQTRLAIPALTSWQIVVRACSPCQPG